MDEKNISPVAYISTDFKDKFGIPRQSGRAPSTLGKIKLIGKYASIEAVNRIEEFSHLWLIFGFSKNPETYALSVRPPRLGGNERVGVFASRAPFRPNGLGLSCVKLLSVDYTDGVSLTVSGADLLDGTPVYDIKPYIPSADKVDGAIGGYSEQFTDYKLKVVFESGVTDILSTQTVKQITECLEDDPRPSYHNDDRVYGMSYADYNVKFRVDKGVLTVFEISLIK